MRIAYGIHGYGRGHSSRALAVLPELTARHDVLVLGGDDAYDALSHAYPVVRIPTLKYYVNDRGRRAVWRTFAHSLPSLLDLRFCGPALEMVCESLVDFQPDVVVSDSEAWTHRAARRLGIPRISFDHYGVLVYCRWPMGWRDRLASRLEAFAYRRLMAGEADRIIVASFYAPPARRAGVTVVGPVLRESVREVERRYGDYLLAYFSRGQHHFTPAVEAALQGAGLPVVVYGTGREGVEGRLDFRPPSNTQFVIDLARSRAVLATAGNQLISEAMHLRKPMLLVPEDCLEQRLNADAIGRMGVGVRTSLTRLTAAQIQEFVAACSGYAGHFPKHRRDGRAAAIAAIERYAAELVGQKATQ